VNFAQGSSMMLGAVFAYTSPCAWAGRSPCGCDVAAALRGVWPGRRAARGAAFASRGSNAWLMATVALGIIADNSVLFTFGKEPRGSCAALGERVARDRRPARLRCCSSRSAVGIALAGALHVFSER